MVGEVSLVGRRKELELQNRRLKKEEPEPELSLLGRIKEGRREPRIDPDSAAIIKSVIRHLERLFNAHQGSVAACPDYGLPDITSLTNGHADPAPEFSKAIRKAIERFEPRLKQPRVTPDVNADDPLRLHFRISATLACEGLKLPVNFRTRLDRDGRFAVED